MTTRAPSMRTSSPAEAESALRRNGFNVVVLQPAAVIDGVTLDVSALVLPVLDPDACAVATRIQVVVGGDGVLLAAGALQPADVDGDRAGVPGLDGGEPGRRRDRRRDEKDGSWWTLTTRRTRVSVWLTGRHDGAGAAPLIRFRLPAELPAVSDGASLFLTVSDGF